MKENVSHRTKNFAGIYDAASNVPVNIHKHEHTNLLSGKLTSHPLSHRSHASGGAPKPSPVGKQGLGDDKPKMSRPQISNTTAPDRILHYHCPQLLLALAAVVTRRRQLPTVGPSQLAMLSPTERKHKSVTPHNLTYKESSASGHAHLSPAFLSQSSVDAHIRKGERGACQCQIRRNAANHGAGRSRRLIVNKKLHSHKKKRLE
jgi:hypothetical protein